MESCFSSLKTERTASRDEAKADVFDYIERFYNPKRRHSTIGHTSPHGVREAGWIGWSRCQPNRCSSTTALYVTELMSNCRIVQCVDAAKQPAC
jgi:hypothetical protein